ncbi:prepilin-type N-terminal cleavage/methylation domain-containing protein [Providencia alcalifaciens]|uniref:prepilin-type N-terminal cleavage/methylation domain-containing protein n=1 Tax=Providencia alcalifaciens TaxID=126385 RepID=UPI002B054EA2|nr:prepilin-type N-terminal cleavage/methylation domain-containing protein [Providencia alcalifaciens]
MLEKTSLIQGKVKWLKNNVDEQGFTLIEILVVLFLCSIVALPAFYQWQQQVKRLQLIDAARQTAEFIYSNLMEGIYLNQHRIVTVNFTAKEWRLVVIDAETAQEISQFKGDKFESIELKYASRELIHFYGRQGTSSPFRIELSNESDQISVIISSSGRVRSCSQQTLAGVPKC